MPFRDAYGFDDYFSADDIYFDLMDKPSQPTKGSAFVYLPPRDEECSSLPLRGLRPIQSFNVFAAHFAAFGNIYRPDPYVLDLRANVARCQKSEAA